jgi:tetratricopeptide (TPR) repeat protein
MCVDQSVDYGAGFGLAFWLSVLVLVICVMVLLVRRTAWSHWQFALAFFFIALIPATGIIPINQPRADRFLYLPSVAGALVVGWLWDWAQPRWRTAGLAFLSASLFWYGWRSWDYSKTFLNETVLWQNVLAVNPKSYRGYADLAANANNNGQPQLALTLVDQALALNPTSYPEGLVIKAYALELLGHLKEAETFYRRAIATGGEDPRWLYLLADLLQRENQLVAAEQTYDRITQLRPNYVEARYAAGILALQMNEPAKAEADIAAVLQADPANPQARAMLELLHRKKTAPVNQPR